MGPQRDAVTSCVIGGAIQVRFEAVEIHDERGRLDGLESARDFVGHRLTPIARARDRCDAYQAPETRGEIGRSSTNEKRVPLPSSVSTFSSPPIACTSCWQIESPRPALENAYSLRFAR